MIRQLCHCHDEGVISLCGECLHLLKYAYAST